MEKIEFTVQLAIAKPIAEVFDGVVNPRTLSSYFVKSASGPLTEGAEVKWQFAEHPGEVPVTVRKVIANELIRFEWPQPEGPGTSVEMRFERLSPSSTLVAITESGWRDTPAGRKSSYANCGGWMHMACCLKARLEHGIGLR